MHDIAIIGGGINGCGIARDAAGRGLSVLLAEKDDLASGTSSASTKLIHGGLRYLEHYEFRLVREALMEREVLLRHGAAHHPAAALRAAASSRAAPGLAAPARAVPLRPPRRPQDPAGDARRRPARDAGRQAAEAGIYRAASSIPTAGSTMRASSCSTPATRRERGAEIRTRTEVVSARRHDGDWQIELRNTRPAQQRRCAARALVNAAGPWVGRGDRPTHRLASDVRRVRLVKGSHIVVRKLFEHDRAYIFQNADGRIIFAIPYEGDFTLIGTTDVDFTGDPAGVAVSTEESSTISAERSSEYFTGRRRARGRRLELFRACARSMTTARSRRRTATRDYVLELDGARASRRCSTSSAARSPPTGGLAEEALAKARAAVSTGSRCLDTWCPLARRQICSR